MISIVAGLLLHGLVPAEAAGAAPLPPPPPPPPPSSARAEPARAQVNLGSLISNDDYPAEALRNEQQGTVGFRLVVGTDGRVTGCTITSSSGHASLDSTTCRLLTARARFTPARDSRGRPTTDSVSARIVWRIEPKFMPMEARLLVAILAVTPAGQVSCSVAVNGKAMATGTCPTPVEGMISTARNSGRTAEQTMVEIIVPEGKAAPADPGNFGERFVDAEARLKVAADGTIVECRVSRLVAANLDPGDSNGPCEPFAAGSKLFEPSADGDSVRNVTVTTRLYGRH